jgi:hypothetical protein
LRLEATPAKVEFSLPTGPFPLDGERTVEVE